MTDLAPIVVAGSAHLDVIAVADRIPAPGESLLGRSLNIQPGGKAANQAAQAALNGHPTALIGRVGDDYFGRDLLARLRSKRIDDSTIARDPDHPTGVSPIFVGDGGEYASIIVPGAAARLSVADIDAAAPVISRGAAVMLQLEIPAGTSAHAARLGRAAGALICLNASPLAAGFAAGCAELLPLTDLLIVNETEAIALAGEPRDSSPAKQIARQLRSRFNVRTVVVTLGARGAMLDDENGMIAVPAFPVEVVDTVGAGDAFAAVLVSELVRGLSLRDALTHATAAGALAASRPGAFDALATRDERLRFMTTRSSP